MKHWELRWDQQLNHTIVCKYELDTLFANEQTKPKQQRPTTTSNSPINWVSAETYYHMCVCVCAWEFSTNLTMHGNCRRTIVNETKLRINIFAIYSWHLDRCRWIGLLFLSFLSIYCTQFRSRFHSTINRDRKRQCETGDCWGLRKELAHGTICSSITFENWKIQ